MYSERNDIAYRVHLLIYVIDSIIKSLSVTGIHRYIDVTRVHNIYGECSIGLARAKVTINK